MNLIEERRKWERQAVSNPLPATVECIKNKSGGVPCLRVQKKRAVSEQVILFLHGGGLVTGSAVTHRSLAAMLTEYLNVPILIVNYRLLPEHAFPAPLDDVLTVYRYLILEQGFSSHNIVIAGDSSGAGLALAMMVALRDIGDDLPAKAFMLSGAFDSTLSGKTMRTNNGRDAMLSYRELVEWRDKYIVDPSNPDLSPLFSDLHNLPAILLIAGGRDLWLSDSERVQSKIRDCGGEVELQVWESMGHVWMMDDTLPETTLAMESIHQFLSRSVSRTGK